MSSSENMKRSLELIAPYLNRRVTADLDGGLFDHVPATFRFRFEDPTKLRARLAENYEDELTESLPCIEGGEWANDALVPVASVSKADNRVRPYEFAWVFFDWESSPEPQVLVTTTDYWGKKRTVSGLDSLKFTVTAE